MKKQSSVLWGRHFPFAQLAIIIHPNADYDVFPLEMPLLIVWFHRIFVRQIVFSLLYEDMAMFSKTHESFLREHIKLKNRRSSDYLIFVCLSYKINYIFAKY
ncbi:MAG: hypothetical protein LBI60_03570 [Bacteroidales bacterium]|jgi:hypothetical protein|nr:hypothetical protein [Bacteroidales bacterium]